MSELTLVLRDHEGPALNDAGQRVKVKDSVVVGLRVDNGRTYASATASSPNKTYERSWQGVPHRLAFATQAFYRAIFCDKRVPEGEIYDCHSYADFAQGLSLTPTRPKDTLGSLTRERSSTPAALMSAYARYVLASTKPPLGSSTRPAPAHSLIALPRRFGIIPESLAVRGRGQDMVVAATSRLPRQYAGQKFYRILG